jgi:hypothetical protein
MQSLDPVACTRVVGGVVYAPLAPALFYVLNADVRFYADIPPGMVLF